MSERAPLSLVQSERLYAEACKVYAGGTTQSKRPELFIEGEYPLFVSRGEGAYLWDVDGNRFLDWMLGLGIVVLGHRDPEVDEAAIREIREGFAFAMTRPVQNRLAELLVEIIPCAELVHFFKAGSDATSAAVRLARIWTRRDKVVRWGYNGWHDWCNPYDAGIPRHVRDDILTFEYNNLDSLEAVLNRNKDQVACIIMMPLEAEAPQPGFLESAKALAHHHSALFILDEMRSGFRMALGGAQEVYHITPDLATFSKAISNGYCISVLAGRADVMQCFLDRTHLSSTFYTNSPAMAAAVATIQRLREGEVIPHLWRIGQRLLDGLNGLAQDARVEARAIGVPPMPDLKFGYQPEERCEEARRVFYTEVTRGGVLLHPRHHWFVSAAHTDADMERTLSVCGEAFDAVRRAL